MSVRASAGNSAEQEMKHPHHLAPRKSFDKKTKPASPKSAFTPLDLAQPTSHITETKTYPILPRSLVVVEHDMAFIRALDCRVTVLNEGTVLAEGSLDAMQADERVIESYLGR